MHRNFFSRHVICLKHILLDLLYILKNFIDFLVLTRANMLEKTETCLANFCKNLPLKPYGKNVNH